MGQFFGLVFLGTSVCGGRQPRFYASVNPSHGMLDQDGNKTIARWGRSDTTTRTTKGRRTKSRPPNHPPPSGFFYVRDKNTTMDILEELRDLIDNGLCRECHSVLTDAELEFGYVCTKCTQDWMDRACWESEEYE